MKPIVWTIAGSDSGGGAGIQADLLTFNDLDVHGCTIITALTAQNSVAVTHIASTPLDNLEAQLQALSTDLPPQAIKLGMLSELSILQHLAPWLARYQNDVPIICDPVMIASSGAPLMQDDAFDYFKQHILSKVDLLTPNLPEAEALLGQPIKTTADTENAAKKISEKFGIKTVLIKGGHANHANDFFYTASSAFWLVGNYYPHRNTHGSGCSLSAAIAAQLAKQHPLRDAVTLAKLYINQAIRHAYSVGHGPGPVAHRGRPTSLEDMPAVSTIPARHPPFPACDRDSQGKTQQLGFYPLVDSAEWLAKLLPFGITTIQLRIKDKTGEALADEIKKSVALARQFNARLFINDYWQLAIKFNAYGVHLGQEDLDTTDLKALRDAGLRLGISTHTPYETARAYALQPSYIAYGPIYKTASKPMSVTPRGIARLDYWRKTLAPYPLVAIGGITEERLPAVLATQPSGIATIAKSVDHIKRMLHAFVSPDKINYATQANERRRYSRHIQLPAIGVQGQEKLKAARVLCVGAGGLGSPLLTYLASAGIGTLGIIDDDTVNLSNLQRQTLYCTQDIGQSKVAVAKARLEALNPTIKIITYNERLDLSHAAAIINEYDIVADGSDNFRTRYIVNDVCFHQQKPNVSASATAFSGQCSVFTASAIHAAAPCYRCLFPLKETGRTDVGIPDCQTAGVLATLPGLLGTIQATEVIKCIIGLGQPLIGKVLTIDAQTMQFNYFPVTRDPHCRLCGQHATSDTLDYPSMTLTLDALQKKQAASPTLQLIDVRRPEEHQAHNIGGKLIPLDQLATRLHEISKAYPVVVYCQAGIRSAAAAKLLRNAGYTEVYNLLTAGATTTALI